MADGSPPGDADHTIAANVALGVFKRSVGGGKSMRELENIMAKIPGRRAAMRMIGMASLGATLASGESLTGRPERVVYVGTYTSAGSRGIYRLRFNPETGGLSDDGLAAEAVNPSYLAVDPAAGHLFAVNEVATLNEQPGGGLSAFSISRRTGQLTPLNQVSSGGAAPCYISIDPTGRYVMAANYSGGNLIVVPVDSKGRLGKASDREQHIGTGGNPQRQSGPRAHCIRFTPDRRHIVAVDLGIDRVIIYRWDSKRGQLLPNEPAEFRTRSGAGPRHIDFHPNGRFAAIINELDSTVVSCRWDGVRGELTEIHSVSTLPAGFSATNYCADIHFHPGGQFVYGSNRGHDSLAIWRVDAETGQLSLVGHESTGGRNPRNFVIDPTGKWLLAANQGSDSIVVFQIDLSSGRLTRTNGSLRVSMPVCLKFG